MSKKKIAAVECGGTSFKVAVCNAEDGTILERASVLTRCEDGGPAATLADVSAFVQAHGPYAAVGIACFGPVGVKPKDRDTYGKILQMAWRGVDILSAIRHAVNDDDCIIAMDTDVNAPAAAEYAAFLQQHTVEDSNRHTTITSCAYVTVGTGVGVGLVVNGATVHGRMHPEGGHVPVQPVAHDEFGGYSWGRRPDAHCPFGGVNTVEGLASSVALTERYQQLLLLQQQQSNPGGSTRLDIAKATIMDRDILETVDDDCEIWDHAAHAVACLCTTLLLTLSVDRIVLGGGVMRRACLLDKIRTTTATQLNGYLDLGSGNANARADLETILTTSKYGDDAGLHGAIFLAQQALHESNGKKQKEKSDESSIETKNKQIAFQYGLWHGFLVGALGTALVFKYGWFGIGQRHGGGGGRR